MSSEYMCIAPKCRQEVSLRPAKNPKNNTPLLPRGLFDSLAHLKSEHRPYLPCVNAALLRMLRIKKGKKTNEAAEILYPEMHC